MNAENLVKKENEIPGSFDVDQMIKIMNLINHKWMIHSTDEYRVPTKEEIMDTIDFLIVKIQESYEYRQGIVDKPIESAMGGIHVTLTMSYSDAFKRSLVDENGHLNGTALKYRWEIQYVPLTNIVYE